MEDVTVVILTKNEEINLPDCLESIKSFAKRIVVVDSISTDKTKEIAQKFGADFYEHTFETHARQFNWALDNVNIDTKWTLRLDADERLTPELCTELSSLMKQHSEDDVNGVTMEAWLYFLGRKMAHSSHEKRKLMLFKTGIGRIEDRKIDEHTILLSGISVSAKNKFIHYDFKDMTTYVNKMNWYATREAQDYFDFIEGQHNTFEGKDSEILNTRKKKYGFYYKLPIFLRVWLLFFYYYIFKGCFLDGKEGFVYMFMYNLWYRTLVDAKIFEHQMNNKPFEENTALKY